MYLFWCDIDWIAMCSVGPALIDIFPMYLSLPAHPITNQTVSLLQLSFAHVEPLQKCHPFCVAIESVPHDMQCGDYQVLVPQSLALKPSPTPQHRGNQSATLGETQNSKQLRTSYAALRQCVTLGGPSLIS